MYLKEIRAHGFKSFADKIKIDLDGNITGIVGPNGSGKSNVVDAIRWVLGEQSVKSLRGDGNMTDVIFSGSKSRSPLNVASVTLVFDNSDKYLPVDFTEVSIKRRVYKDGSNEYYLNNEKCRLKDITDILMDSGIAKESFNIISQGKIDEIISTKATDRRVIFEEAAGVLKYKKRKEDALRKLERTHDNMDRVNDIIKELEVQVEPLKEQKEKALLYNETKEELERIELALITDDITNINANYQKDKLKIEELNNEILNLSTNNNVFASKMEECKNKLNKLEIEIKEKQLKLLELTTKVEQLNSQKQIVLERQKYQIEDAKLHTNLVNLKEQQLKYNNEISILDNIINEKTIELSKSVSNLDELNSNLEKIKSNKNSLLNSLNNKVREKSNNDISIERLSDSIENNSLLPNAVRNILNNPKLNGIRDTFGNILEVEDLYKTAISTSISSSASNIIVDNETSIKEAINYLKNMNLGRATFYPLNVIKPKAIEENIISNLSKINGFIDIASNLVKFDRLYNNVVLNQLGNVIIANNIETANMISRIVNYRFKIVTLDGQVINVGGSVTGGSQIKYKNIITEKFELEKAINEKNKINLDISNLENKINESDYDYKTFEDKLYLETKNKLNIEEYINAKKNMKSEYLNSINSIEKEISGTNNILSNSLNKEEEEILNKYYEALKEKEVINSKLNILNSEKKNLNDALEEYEFESRKENSVFNSKNKELKDLEISVNRYDVKLDNLLNILNETYNITYEKASNLYHLEIDTDVARNKVNNLKKMIKDMGIVNLAAPDEYDRVSVRYEFLIGQREDLVKAEVTLLDIIKDLDGVMEHEFLETFNVIKNNFTVTFKELFKGGTAELKLTDPSNLLETGVEIIASPPGKKLTTISLLSGGEKTFTAISLLFAILKSRPVPFCILDEVEAALDEVNVDSFGHYLVNLKEKTQFILITHKKKTMEYANTLYGITMQESGVSKLVSVRLEDIK